MSKEKETEKEKEKEPEKVLEGEDEYIEMKVTGLTIDPFTNMPIIIIKDLEEKSAIPIWIGLIEASAIATELEQIQLTRPMTHDLLRNILLSLDVTVTKIEISDLRDNTFFANIHLRRDGKDFVIDARPSDAIALGLRTSAGLFVSKRVIEKSRRIDLGKEALTGSEDPAKKEKWAEILENLSPDAFGKYKM